jgi:hypothetical protein
MKNLNSLILFSIVLVWFFAGALHSQNIRISNIHHLGVSNGYFIGAHGVETQAGSSLSLGNGLMHLTGHFANAGTLNAGTSTVLLHGTALQNISGGLIAFHNLNLDNALGMQLNTSVTVGNTLTMTSGNINTQSNVIELGTSGVNTGTLVHLSGLVHGRMVRWFAAATNTGNASGLFPLGVGSDRRYMLVEYTGAPSSGGTLLARFEQSPMEWQPPHLSPTIPLTGSCPEFKVTTYSDEGYWDVVEDDGLSGGTYTVTLTGEGVQTVNDLCQLTALRRQGVGNWEVPFGSVHVEPWGSLGVPVVQRTGNIGWSNWGIAGGDPNFLPVELLSFKAECVGEGVQLTWLTASELNNDYFLVEHSTDGVEFDALGIVQGSGTTNLLSSYEFLHEHRENETRYYRLVQNDYNGVYTVYGPVYSNCGLPLSAQSGIFVYPNPFADYITVVLDNVNSGNLQIALYDKMGKLLLSDDMAVSDDQVRFTMNLAHLSRAVYELRIFDGRKVYNARIVRQ